MDNMVAITAIPVDEFSVGSAALYGPTISEDDFAPPLTNAIVIGQYAAVDFGIVIPIIRNSGKVKDTEQDQVAGRAHNVSIQCEVDDRDSSLWQYIRQLERSAFHLILTLHDGSRVFVQVTRDTYQCTTERGDGKTSMQFKVHNLTGMQLVVPVEI